MTNQPEDMRGIKIKECLPAGVHSIYELSNKNPVHGIKIYAPSLNKAQIIPRVARWINKYLYPFGVGAAYNKYEKVFALYSAKKDEFLYNEYGKNDIFCNFGSGSFYHKRWKNFDYSAQNKEYKVIQGVENVDFTAIDLNTDNLILPFNDNCVSLVYFSHTIEHLEEAKANKFLSECFRILKPRGVLRIVIPSIDIHMQILSMIDAQQILSKANVERLAQEVARHVYTDSAEMPPDELIALIRAANFQPAIFKEAVSKLIGESVFNPNNPGRHISIWNYEKILQSSEKFGFSACIPCYRGSSTRKPFTNTIVFDNSEAQFSQYIELIK